MPASFFEFACQPGWTVVNCRSGAESAEIRSALLERFTGSGMLHFVCLNGSGSISGAHPAGEGLVVQRTHGRDFRDWRQAILCAARSGADVLFCSGLQSRATLDFALTVSEHISRVVFFCEFPGYTDLLRHFLKRPGIFHGCPCGTLVDRGFRVLYLTPTAFQGLDFGYREYDGGSYNIEALQPQLNWNLVQ